MAGSTGSFALSIVLALREAASRHASLKGLDPASRNEARADMRRMRKSEPFPVSLFG